MIVFAQSHSSPLQFLSFLFLVENLQCDLSYISFVLEQQHGLAELVKFGSLVFETENDVAPINLHK